jgi:hypothetical protein
MHSFEGSYTAKSSSVMKNADLNCDTVPKSVEEARLEAGRPVEK